MFAFAVVVVVIVAFSWYLVHYISRNNLAFPQLFYYPHFNIVFNMVL